MLLWEYCFICSAILRASSMRDVAIYKIIHETMLCGSTQRILRFN